MPARVGIQVRTSHFNLASLRFGDLCLDLSTIHGRFMTEQQYDRMNGLTLFRGVPLL